MWRNKCSCSDSFNEEKEGQMGGFILEKSLITWTVMLWLEKKVPWTVMLWLEKKVP